MSPEGSKKRPNPCDTQDDQNPCVSDMKNIRDESHQEEQSLAAGHVGGLESQVPQTDVEGDPEGTASAATPVEENSGRDEDLFKFVDLVSVTCAADVPGCKLRSLEDLPSQQIQKDAAHYEIKDFQMVDCSNTTISPLLEQVGSEDVDQVELLILDLESRASALSREVMKLRPVLEQWQERMTVFSSQVAVQGNEIAFVQTKDEDQATRVQEHEQMVRGLKTELSDLREGVTKQIRSVGEEFERDFLKATDDCGHQTMRLHEEISKCRSYLESSNKDRNIKKKEIERMKSKMQDAYRTLELKNMKIEQQLKSSKEDLTVKKHEIVEMKAIIFKMEQAYRRLELKSSTIEQQLYETLAGRDVSYPDGLPTPYLLESTAKDMFSSIGRLCNLYDVYVNASRDAYPEREQTFASYFKLHYLTMPAHSTFLLKTWISNILFNGFEKESFDASRDHAPPCLENKDRISKDRVRICFGYFQRSSNRVQGSESSVSAGDMTFDSQFIRYFDSKIAPMMLDEVRPVLTHLNIHGVNDSSVPDNGRFNLVEALIVAAKRTWDFHKLCLSFEPQATIFRVKSGDDYDITRMHSSVGLEEDPKFFPKVGFMVYPGFSLGTSIIKSEVYFGVNP